MVTINKKGLKVSDRMQTPGQNYFLYWPRMLALGINHDGVISRDTGLCNLKWLKGHNFTSNAHPPASNNQVFSLAMVGIAVHNNELCSLIYKSYKGIQYI